MILFRARRGLVVLLACLAALAGCEPADKISNTAEILQQETEGEFERVVPGKEWNFPEDHLSHPRFRTEWWYLTANLKSESGETFGVQWTLFRLATDTEGGKGWKTPQVYMAHTVVTSEDKTWYAERFARGGIGQAGVLSNPYRAWLDNWSWRSPGDTPFPGRVEFADGDMAADLEVRNSGALVFQGDKGYSKKHRTEDIASYYFSAPFLEINGTLQLDGKSYQVAGKGWYDREWSSQGLTKTQLGWDWFSIHLDDGSALMLYQIREKGTKAYYFGSLSWPDGKTIVLQPEEIRLVPTSYSTLKGKSIPLKWRIDVPAHQIDLKVDVVRKEQWLPFVFSYWEGPIKVSGSHSGQGFMELTGY